MPADAALTDAGNADGADAGPADSAVPDSSADSGPADSGATDSGSGDAAADGGPTDSGAGDGGTGGASWPADRLACFKANGWTFPPRSATGGKPAKDCLETNGWLETAGGWVPPPARSPAQRIAKAEGLIKDQKHVEAARRSVGQPRGVD